MTYDPELEKVRVKLGSPGFYRILVSGQVADQFKDRLHGMNIVASSQNTGALTTTIQGHVTDQAQLQGILTTLYDMHLPILSVERDSDESH
ncbi:MAG: hypothetical protein WBM45_12760 [Woeseiaceae bacterium]